MKFSLINTIKALAFVAATAFAIPTANLPFTCPEDCTEYYDGCNSCTCGRPVSVCTQKICVELAEPKCVQKNEGQDKVIAEQDNLILPEDAAVDIIEDLEEDEIPYAMADAEESIVYTVEDTIEDLEEDEMLYAMPDVEESTVYTT
ncbi:hypothetical protein SARC_05204 [Sphaeroforma arctica JP610]|uniref:Pacifastin domain-containing protein n=1 Tax=Sphaeroforma arctica JP610 TaxID=667725 RepID=A0A0L0G0Z0_9EUKA|nr:hypothetical protein SARC_05204 [Sphaeroforma arctica JP610]KNC82504.1 hypothetical protein SARC_05204 [Sphaeroforma arctica JP610]|eukprot:XP_014156406.1 hypothetical protein SARC_05204 [Sphaeroforma arctica JP610]